MQVRSVIVGAALLATTIVAPARAGVDIGEAGRPANKAVAYFPCDTQAWPVAVNDNLPTSRVCPLENFTLLIRAGLRCTADAGTMVIEKYHSGYRGDMPANTAISRIFKQRRGTDMKIVGALGTSIQHSNIFLFHNDVPDANRLTVSIWS